MTWLGRSLGIAIMAASSFGAFAFQAEQKMGKADAKAAELAAETVKAMGGMDNYNATRYISWNFFGRRDHVWDKWTGDYRMQTADGKVVVMNINTKEGKVWEKSVEVTDQAKLKEHLQKAYEAWINDSYWLVMPYKLRDPGVTLSYVREGKTQEGRDADVLSLTFEGVGVTPQNKYEVYIDKESKLITQWDFFSKADDEKPRFQTPWAEWKTFGKIKLSGNRGQYSLNDIAVHSDVPENTFKNAEPVTF